MSITPRKCKAAALATAPVAAALGAYGFLKGATKFYSSQVNGCLLYTSDAADE